MPTLLAAALLVFMRSFADFGTPMLIGEGYRTFPVVLYTEFINEVGGSDGFAAAIAVIAIVITTLVFLVQKYISNKNAFALNSMHPVEEREARKGINALVHLAVYLVVGIASCRRLRHLHLVQEHAGQDLCGRLLAAKLPDRHRQAGSQHPEHHHHPLAGTGRHRAAGCSHRLSGGAPPQRPDQRGGYSLDDPYIVPGTVLGIALLIGFNKPPLLISGTMLIMVVALIIRRLPIPSARRWLSCSRSP